LKPLGETGAVFLCPMIMEIELLGGDSAEVTRGSERAGVERRPKPKVRFLLDDTHERFEEKLAKSVKRTNELLRTTNKTLTLIAQTLADMKEANGREREAHEREASGHESASIGGRWDGETNGATSRGLGLVNLSPRA
jgi:hypothetical protein